MIDLTIAITAIMIDIFIQDMPKSFIFRCIVKNIFIIAFDNFILILNLEFHRHKWAKARHLYNFS